MKKTLLASAILLAGTANAAEIYNNEGTVVNLDGSFRGELKIDASDDYKFQDGGSRFKVKASKDLGEGTKVFGKVEVKYNDASATFDGSKLKSKTDVVKGTDGNEKTITVTQGIKDAVTNHDGLYFSNTYVGVENETYGTVTVGKQSAFDDDLYLYDYSYVYTQVGSQGARDQLKYAKSFGGAKVVASVMNQDVYAIGASYEVAGLTVGANYTGLDKDSETVVSAQYVMDAFSVGATYQLNDTDNKDSSNYGLGAQYEFGQTTAYVVFDSLEDDSTDAIVGAAYQFAENVKGYAELGSTKPDSGDSDENVTVGARFYF